MSLAPLLFSAAALAHPGGKTYPSHRILLTVEADRVRVDAGVLLPTHWIMDEIEDELDGAAETLDPQAADAFTAAKVQELILGLRLEIDGEKAPLAEIPIDAASGLGDEKYLKYQFALEAPLPGPGGYALELSNANYPGELSFFLNEVRVGPAIEVERCSLFRWEAGRARGNLDGQLRMEDSLREIELEIQAHGGASGWLRQRLNGPDLRPVAEAVDPSLGQALSRGELTPQTAVFGAGAAGVFVLGAGGVLLRRRGRSGESDEKLDTVTRVQ